MPHGVVNVLNNIRLNLFIFIVVVQLSWVHPLIVTCTVHNMLILLSIRTIGLSDKTSGNTLLIILIIFAAILIVLFVLIITICAVKKRLMCVAKKTFESEEDHNRQPAYYEEITQTQYHEDILMEENTAYGHITQVCN